MVHKAINNQVRLLSANGGGTSLPDRSAPAEA